MATLNGEGNKKPDQPGFESGGYRGFPCRAALAVFVRGEDPGARKLVQIGARSF
jgi:hypothetical protein